VSYVPFVSQARERATATPEEPNLPLRAARNQQIVRWYREGQVMHAVTSDRHRRETGVMMFAWKAGQE
jgi:hypothetical protein